jgi:hypothetical protein
VELVEAEAGCIEVEPDADQSTSRARPTMNRFGRMPQLPRHRLWLNEAQVAKVPRREVD